MPWTILTLPEFDVWFEGLTEREQDGLDAPIRTLEQIGPILGRPYVDTLKDSKHSNMKELRKPGGTLRVLFAFDAKRRAVLLIGGDKSGDSMFYERMIPIADRLLEEYLADCDNGGKSRQ